MDPKQFNEYLTNLRKEIRDGAAVDESDLTLLAGQISDRVDSFLQENNFVVPSKAGRVSVSFEAIDDLGDQIVTQGVAKISDLIEECNIHPNHREEAAAKVAILMKKHSEARGATLLSGQSLSLENINSDLQALPIEKVFSDQLINELNDEAVSYSAESFGIDMDRSVPDLKMDIVITLMRFHADLTTKLLPVRPTAEPAIRWTKENAEVYDLTDPDVAPKQLVDLYEDPSLVDTELRPIIPLVANDATKVVADGVLAFSMEANILELSIDATKPGYTKINTTDLVADGVVFEKVYFELTDGSSTENFVFNVPVSYGRLSRNANNLDVAERSAAFEALMYLTKGSKMSNGVASTLLNDAANEEEGMQVKFLISVKTNLKTGVTWATASLSTIKHQVNGEATSGSWDTQFATLSVAPTGYSLDAKFSEQNMRKSNIAVRASRQSLTYEIPTGRNYLVDYAIGQDNALLGRNNAATLTKVIRIGQGRRTLGIIGDTLNHVSEQVAAFKAGELTAARNPGFYYVAGAKVRPYVFSDTLDLSGLTALRDCDRTGDIRAHVETYLNHVISKIESNSFFSQQLAPGAVSQWRVITSNFVKDNVLAQPHIHDHLMNKNDSAPDVEYRLVLPGGYILDVVTTTDSRMSSKMYIYPFLTNSKESELNFGHNWDYGTMVGHHHVSGADRQQNNRMFANTRELAFPTNPIGAIIDVAGIDSATFVS